MELFRREIITGHGYCNITDVYSHEYVITERLEKFVNYLKSLTPLIILPSIIVCDKTNALIDGHHRCSALLQLGFKACPVTYIDYENAQIVPHIDKKITKKEIINAALSNTLLPPKTSYHHIIDSKGEYRPIVLLSYLSDMK